MTNDKKKSNSGDKKSSSVAKFIQGQISLTQAQQETGKSRATIYRYAKMVSEGKDLVDRRKFGNNRKYGKKSLVTI